MYVKTYARIFRSLFVFFDKGKSVLRLLVVKMNESYSSVAGLMRGQNPNGKLLLA